MHAPGRRPPRRVRSSAPIGQPPITCAETTGVASGPASNASMRRAGTAEGRERSAVAVDRHHVAAPAANCSSAIAEMRGARRPTRTASADSRAPACRRRADGQCRPRFPDGSRRAAARSARAGSRTRACRLRAPTPWPGSVIAARIGCTGGASSLNPIGPLERQRVEEVIGVHGLRSAGEAVDPIVA